MSGAAFVTGDDASVNVISEAFDLCLISKGPITLGNNIFIGYDAITLPNVGIGAAHAAVMTDKPAAMVRQERIRMDIDAQFSKSAKATFFIYALVERDSSFRWSTAIHRRCPTAAECRHPRRSRAGPAQFSFPFIEK